MNYIINGKEYIYASDFKDNEKIRHSFNWLTKKIYGFDFEQWYQDGNWGDGYISHILLDGENATTTTRCCGFGTKNGQKLS